RERRRGGGVQLTPAPSRRGKGCFFRRMGVLYGGVAVSVRPPSPQPSPPGEKVSAAPTGALRLKARVPSPRGGGVRGRGSLHTAKRRRRAIRQTLMRHLICPARRPVSNAGGPGDGCCRAGGSGQAPGRGAGDPAGRVRRAGGER